LGVDPARAAPGAGGAPFVGGALLAGGALASADAPLAVGAGLTESDDLGAGPAGVFRRVDGETDVLPDALAGFGDAGAGAAEGSGGVG